MAGRTWLDDPNTSSHVTFSQAQIHNSGRNVFHLLSRREISPRTKCFPSKQWGLAPKQNAESSFGLKGELLLDARRGLYSWVEAESLQHLSAKYCPLVPPPRSTIAAAFSPDGRTIASSHGDHTVKIIDCQSGSCLKVLSGHRRTPWVVRYHPEHPDILASGSLDHEVRLWDASMSKCIGSRNFCRPIASIAFHAEGELLAVASGHKLYLWHYNSRGETSSPAIVLKTRRSLRAVHFHPHAAPFLLTAEVNDLDPSDSSMVQATTLGYLHYPPPTVYLANVPSSDRHNLRAELSLMSSPFLYLPSSARDYREDLHTSNRPFSSSNTQVESSTPAQFQSDSNAMEHYDHMVYPMEMSPSIPTDTYAAIQDNSTNDYLNELQPAFSDIVMDAVETTDAQLVEGYRQSGASNQDISSGANNAVAFISQSRGVPGFISSQPERVLMGFRRNQFLPFGDPKCWELPFLQGWLMGQSQAGMQSQFPLNAGAHAGYHGFGSPGLTSNSQACNIGSSAASLPVPASTNQLSISERSASSDHSLNTHLTSLREFGQSAASNFPHNGGDSVAIVSRIQSELAASLAATAAAELPCTVKLRIWLHDIKNPCASLHAESCRLTIPHAVLCSEMGAHFSPCGRFLAACVACVLPPMEADPGLLTQLNQDFNGAATSPTRHPVSSRQIVYELRIYSLEESTFGSVLVSRPIRAAHCLTSIQFSPTSEHILLAYGRRHSSLLKTIIVNGETSIPVYTVLEVYRVSDMELVSVLPSAEDEVNVASFHPLPGGGLVYGTKEGKLRVLHYGYDHGANCSRQMFFPEQNMLEVQTYALEC